MVSESSQQKNIHRPEDDKPQHGPAGKDSVDHLYNGKGGITEMRKGAGQLVPGTAGEKKGEGRFDHSAGIGDLALQYGREQYGQQGGQDPGHALSADDRNFLGHIAQQAQCRITLDRRMGKEEAKAEAKVTQAQMRARGVDVYTEMNFAQTDAWFTGGIDQERSQVKAIMFVQRSTNQGLRLSIEQDRIVGVDAVSVAQGAHYPNFVKPVAMPTLVQYGINQVQVTGVSSEQKDILQIKDTISKQLGGPGWAQQLAAKPGEAQPARAAGEPVQVPRSGADNSAAAKAKTDQAPDVAIPADRAEKILAAFKDSKKSLEDTGNVLNQGIGRLAAQIRTGQSKLYGLPEQMAQQQNSLYPVLNQLEQQILRSNPNQLSSRTINDCVKAYEDCAKFMRTTASRLPVDRNNPNQLTDSLKHVDKSIAEFSRRYAAVTKPNQQSAAGTDIASKPAQTDNQPNKPVEGADKTPGASKGLSGILSTLRQMITDRQTGSAKPEQKEAEASPSAKAEATQVHSDTKPIEPEYDPTTPLSERIKGLSGAQQGVADWLDRCETDTKRCFLNEPRSAIQPDQYSRYNQSLSSLGKTERDIDSATAQDFLTKVGDRIQALESYAQLLNDAAKTAEGRNSGAFVETVKDFNEDLKETRQHLRSAISLETLEKFSKNLPEYQKERIEKLPFEQKERLGEALGTVVSGNIRELPKYLHSGEKPLSIDAEGAFNDILHRKGISSGESRSSDDKKDDCEMSLHLDDSRDHIVVSCHLDKRTNDRSEEVKVETRDRVKGDFEGPLAKDRAEIDKWAVNLQRHMLQQNDLANSLKDCAMELRDGWDTFANVFYGEPGNKVMSGLQTMARDQYDQMKDDLYKSNTIPKNATPAEALAKAQERIKFFEQSSQRLKQAESFLERQSKPGEKLAGLVSPAVFKQFAQAVKTADRSVEDAKRILRESQPASPSQPPKTETVRAKARSTQTRDTEATRKTAEQSPAQPYAKAATKPESARKATEKTEESKPADLSPGIKTASGATVHMGKDGQVDQIDRSDGTVIRVNYRTVDGKRVLDNFAEERTTVNGEQMSGSIVPYTRKGDEFVAYNPLGAKLELPSSLKDVQFHANGNMTYVGSENTKDGKKGEMTIIRGDGTTLTGLSDKPEFHGPNARADFTEFKFDSRGRITNIIPSSKDFWENGMRSREFAWKGDSNELAKVSTIAAAARYRDQNGKEQFVVYNRDLQSKSQATCQDNFGHQYPVPPGETSLDKNGVYTAPDFRQQGQYLVAGIMTAPPHERDKFVASQSVGDQRVSTNPANGQHETRPAVSLGGSENLSEQDRLARASHLLDHIQASPETKARALNETEFDKAFLARFNEIRRAYGLQEATFDPETKLWAGENTDRQCASGMGHYVVPDGYRQNSAYGAYVGPGPGQDTRSHYAIADMWMNSPDHRSAMLDPNVNLLGISQLRGQDSNYYTTLNLRRGNPVDPSLLSQTSPQEITTPAPSGASVLSKGLASVGVRARQELAGTQEHLKQKLAEVEAKPSDIASGRSALTETLKSQGYYSDRLEAILNKLEKRCTESNGMPVPSADNLADAYRVAKDILDKPGTGYFSEAEWKGRLVVQALRNLSDINGIDQGFIVPSEPRPGTCGESCADKFIAQRDARGYMTALQQVAQTGSAMIGDRLITPADVAPGFEESRWSIDTEGGHHQVGQQYGYDQYGRPLVAYYAYEQDGMRNLASKVMQNLCAAHANHPGGGTTHVEIENFTRAVTGTAMRTVGTTGSPYDSPDIIYQDVNDSIARGLKAQGHLPFLVYRSDHWFTINDVRESTTYPGRTEVLVDDQKGRGWDPGWIYPEHVPSVGLR